MKAPIHPERQPHVEVLQLKKDYAPRARLLSSLFRGARTSSIVAVNGVSLAIGRGEIVALVGESGSGKSTLGKLMTMLEDPTSGEVRVDGVRIDRLRGHDSRSLRRKVQMIFQDPYESLDPRLTVLETLREPLQVHKTGRDARAQTNRVVECLEMVELRPGRQFIHRYPHELSGGQRQRVSVARAIILRPEFIVADEPVSMMDTSVQAGVLNMMLKLKRELALTYLIITHSLPVARYMADRIAIMYLGDIVELGATDDVLQEPAHPYSRILMAAAPVVNPSRTRTRVQVKGEIPNPANRPTGCAFHTRCPHVEDICVRERPKLVTLPNGNQASCHFAAEIQRLPRAE